MAKSLFILRQYRNGEIGEKCLYCFGYTLKVSVLWRLPFSVLNDSCN